MWDFDFGLDVVCWRCGYCGWCDNCDGFDGGGRVGGGGMDCNVLVGCGKCVDFVWVG